MELDTLRKRFVSFLPLILCTLNIYKFPEIVIYDWSANFNIKLLLEFIISKSGEATYISNSGKQYKLTSHMLMTRC